MNPDLTGARFIDINRAVALPYVRVDGFNVPRPASFRSGCFRVGEFDSFCKRLCESVNVLVYAQKIVQCVTGLRLLRAKMESPAF